MTNGSRAWWAALFQYRHREHGYAPILRHTNEYVQSEDGLAGASPSRWSGALAQGWLPDEDWRAARSGDGDDGGVEFPDGGDLGGAAIVIEIFEGHAEDFGG